MHGGEDGVGACAHVLDHLVEPVVDEVGVVAQTADHDVGAAGAVEQVVAGVAVEGVCLVVAVALQVGAALQHKRLYVRRQSVMGGRKYYVRALAGVLECRVAGIVGKIGVVAEPADHEVGGRTTVEQIVAGVAVDHVHETVAVALQVGAALQHQSSRRSPSARS